MISPLLLCTVHSWPPLGMRPMHLVKAVVCVHLQNDTRQRASILCALLGVNPDKLEKAGHLPPAVLRLLKGCFQPDSHKRPTWQEAAQHKAFRGLAHNLPEDSPMRQVRPLPPLSAVGTRAP
jgi:hypothetical protein